MAKATHHKMRCSKQFQQVALIGLSGGGLDAQIVRGLNLCRRGLQPWRVYDAGHQGVYIERTLDRLTSFDGVIGHITSPKTARLLADGGLPVVDLAGFVTGSGFALVSADNRAVGRFAADHLADLRCVRFICVSNAMLPFERQRWAGFRDRLLERQPDAPPLWFVRENPQTIDAHDRVLGDAPDLSEHLRNVAEPTAIFCTTDRAAFTTCELCASCDVPVPERAAVLGVDNNAYLCETSEPQLSSIMLPGERIGHEAAALLQRMMNGEPPPPTPMLLPPVGVHTRQSTQMSAIDDPGIAEALRLLREHATEATNVTDIAEQVHMDRRTFYRRFKSRVGRTPLQELYRLRLQLAQQRLVASNASIYTIAIESGFPDADTFTRRFRDATGTTPRDYRKAYAV